MNQSHRHDHRDDHRDDHHDDQCDDQAASWVTWHKKINSLLLKTFINIAHISHRPIFYWTEVALLYSKTHDIIKK